MVLFTMKAIFMILVPAYRVDLPVDIFPKELVYVEYVKGKPSVGVAIKSNDDRFVSLKNIIYKNNGEWRYDINSYAPNRTFTSPKLLINCLDDTVVVNYQNNDNDWIQISNSEATCFEGNKDVGIKN